MKNVNSTKDYTKDLLNVNRRGKSRLFNEQCSLIANSKNTLVWRKSRGRRVTIRRSLTKGLANLIAIPKLTR